jgi:hypothetical protein
MFKIRRAGIAQLQDQLSDGLEAVAERILDVARPNTPVLTGELQDSLHTDLSHSREWPDPAVFVATATGDGFFVHEGTSDTPAQPWLSRALDQVRGEIPSIIRSETKGKEFGITRR